MDIWEVLGIEPTTNKREIKKAYAKMLEKYHPEEEPGRFEAINRAYELALFYTDINWDEAGTEAFHEVSAEAAHEEDDSIFTDFAEKEGLIEVDRKRKPRELKEGEMGTLGLLFVAMVKAGLIGIVAVIGFVALVFFIMWLV